MKNSIPKKGFEMETSSHIPTATLPQGCSSALNTDQAALVTGLAPATLMTLRSRGGGPRFVKCGRAVRYPLEELKSWMAQRTVGSTSERETPVNTDLTGAIAGAMAASMYDQIHGAGAWKMSDRRTMARWLEMATNAHLASMKVLEPKMQALGDAFLARSGVNGLIQ